MSGSKPARRRPGAGARTLRAFLPAAQALESTPPRPAARALAWTLMSLSAAALLWACVGRVDIVAVAEGRVIPGDRVKTVQAMERARIEAILVEEGERVARGQPLLRLDSTVPAAERTALEAGRNRFALTEARLQAQLALLQPVLDGQAELPLGTELTLGSVPAGVTAQAARRAALQGAQALAALSASLQALDQQALAEAGEQRAAAHRLQRLERLLPLLEERTQAAAVLADKGLGARVEWLALEEQRLGQHGLRAVLQAEQAAVQAAAGALAARRRALLAETAGRWLGELAEARSSLAEYRQALTKAHFAESSRTLNAPVDGTVQQLRVHTEGGVVQPGEPLLRVVPASGPLRLEVAVQNRDIGFVRAGQQAVVKVHTFPFTRYGTLEAVVASVSRDAVDTAQGPPHYLAHLLPGAGALAVDGGTGGLSPGMAVTVEILTGRRRLIEYLWTPLARRLGEAARER